MFLVLVGYLILDQLDVAKCLFELQGEVRKHTLVAVLRVILPVFVAVHAGLHHDDNLAIWIQYGAC